MISKQLDKADMGILIHSPNPKNSLWVQIKGLFLVYLLGVVLGGQDCFNG